MLFRSCDDDFQAVFYFKLQELYSQFANLEKTCSDKFAIIFYKRLLKKIEAVYESYWNYAEKKGYSGTAIFTKHKEFSLVTFVVWQQRHY